MDYFIFSTSFFHIKLSQLFPHIERLLERKEETTMIIERVFTGTETLLEVLSSLIDYQIDKLLNASYDDDRTNVTPDKKGVAE
jgi:hypothetical protein